MFTFTFAFWTMKRGEQSKEKRQTHITFDCIRLYICSQSVTLIVDIHLPLITWLQIGGLLCKTVHFMWEKGHWLFVMYYSLLACIHWFFSLMHVIVLHCGVKLCSSNVNHHKQPWVVINTPSCTWFAWKCQQDNQHCVVFGLISLWQHSPLTV